MKIGMYSAVKTVYSNEGAGNMRPVAFDYVPYGKRGSGENTEKAENASDTKVRDNFFTGFRAAVKTA